MFKGLEHLSYEEKAGRAQAAYLGDQKALERIYQCM